MPRQAKPKPADLTINLNTDREILKDDASPDPNTSPMNLQGIDLSSFGGDFGPSLMDLPPLPLSPPPPSSPRFQDPLKTIPSTSKTRAEQEQRADPPRRRGTKDDDEYPPGSGSMSKIYHLRKNPGSTPELSLVGSAENVGKLPSEGESGETT